MQLYSGVSTHFVNQAIGNQIAYALADNFRRYFGYTPSDSEVKSWNNSLRDMANAPRFSGSTLLLQAWRPTRCTGQTAPRPAVMRDGSRLLLDVDLWHTSPEIRHKHSWVIVSCKSSFFGPFSSFRPLFAQKLR